MKVARLPREGEDNEGESKDSPSVVVEEDDSYQQAVKRKLANKNPYTSPSHCI